MIRIFTKRFNQLDLSEDMYIQNIDEYIGTYESSDDVFVIDGFSDLYDEISDEALEQLEGILRTSEKNAIVFDDMSRISDYSSTELYLKLVKSNFGMVVGGNADNNIAFLLSDGLYSIPEDYRDRDLETSQAIVYFNDTASYVQLGGA